MAWGRFITAAIVLSGFAGGPAGSLSGAQTAGERRALLVGVTELLNPALAKDFNLRGPANDVDLFRRLLQQPPFGFPAANIRSLSGLPADVTQRPTRANIEREFRALRDVAKPGDQILILMAGHGSQQPANRDSTDDEPDGLDEIFIPADAGAWDRTDRRVTNAIVDDDIRRWVTDIRGRGASVWMIFDSCHSGTMTRGAPETFERERQIPIAALVPRDEIDRAMSAARSTRGGGDSAGRLGLGESVGEIAALFASNMVETTPERPMPDEAGPVHGLFSYTIASLLSQSTSAMTYRELSFRVLQRYRALGRVAPTPMFEGGGLDREILGVRTWPDRPQMLIGQQASPEGWDVAAGSVQGLSTGSILEVFPPAGTADADRSIGHVRVTSVTPLSARVLPAPFDNQPAAPAARLVPGSRARVKHYEFGDLGLTVALQQGASGDDVVIVPTGRGPTPVEQALALLPKLSNGLVRRVDTPGANWFVRVEGSRLLLIPASGWQPLPRPGTGAAGVDQPKTFDGGQVADPNLPEVLADRLKKIARASNLMRMSAVSSDLAVTLQVSRYDAASGGKARPLFSTADDVIVRYGDYLEYRVTNLSRVAVDVTLLYIDARYGITPWFPRQSEIGDMKVLPGQSRTLGLRSEIGEPAGWESVVAIAVESSLTPQDFRMLGQDPVPGVRGGPNGVQSPLWQLMCDATACLGTRGPLPPRDLGRFGMKVVSWRTVEK